MAQITLNSSGVASSGSLVLQSNGTTTAATFDTSQKLTLPNDATISGLTVGKGGGAGSSNTALGVSALTSAAGSNYNTALGYQAGYSASTGNGANSFVGYQSGYAVTTGESNSFFGTNSAKATTTGSYNTSVGKDALQANTTASNNTAVGYQAGYSVTGGANLCLGASSGASLTTGANNIHLGNTSASSSSASQEIVLGATSGSSVVGKGSNTGYIYAGAGGVYQGNNSSSWSTTSDFRLKKNIVDNTEGLDKISQIRVRNFEYRTAEEVTELPAHTVIDKQGVQLGVIAQELQQVCPDCVKEESTGVLAVDSDNVFWHMVNAIKDLKAIVDAQAAEIAELKAKVA